MSYRRKIDATNRVSIPTEYMEKYNLQSKDYVDIKDEHGIITIEKHQPEFVCAITGKVTDKGERIGDAFISYEGMEQIIEITNQKENFKK